MTRRCADDQAWFRAHRPSRSRWRDCDPAEFAELNMVFDSTMSSSYVRVLVVNRSRGAQRRYFVVHGVVLAEALDVPPVRGWAA